MKDPTFKIYSLGCRTNQAEIEEISEKLISHGFSPALSLSCSPALVIINTCVVTQKAERETRKTIRHFRRLYPKSFLVVLGCGVDAKQKIKIQLPQANLLISNKEKQKTVSLILQNLISPRRSRGGRPTNKYFQSGRALVKIQDGCNHFCTYCIVPVLRGKPKSENPKIIIKEIKKLNNQKISEVILSGINLSLYGQDLQPKTSLFSLLKKILKETKIKRITLSSLDPEILDEEFVQLVIDNPRLSRFLHFSLQSGSLTVLKRMNRQLDIDKFIKFLEKIKEKIPHFVFRADVIVGFPQETEKEFQETLQLIKLLPISFVHVFPYSPRPGTLAFKKIQNGQWQDIPEKIKRERVKIILDTTKKIREEQAKNFIGQTLDCLIIRKLDNGFWETLADNSWKVLVKDRRREIQPGQIRKVKIVKRQTDFLIGSFF